MQKPVYPEWSERCEHTYGIPLTEALLQFVGTFSVINTMRREIEDAPEIERKQLWRCYWAAVSEKNVGFAERVASEFFYTTGIRFPYAENPVREHIPPELWPRFKIMHEENMVQGRDWDNRRITYVDIRVSARFWHSDGYDRVAVRNIQFRLNKTQAQIVRLLHQALKQGEHEGLFAKRLLAQVGKASGDIGDYFKDQELWRFLIVKTAPGRYRLNAYGLGY